MTIIITYEKYTLRVLSVTRFKESINEPEVISGAMYKTVVTSKNDAYYTDTKGNMYMNRDFIKQ